VSGERRESLGETFPQPSYNRQQLILLDHVRTALFIFQPKLVLIYRPGRDGRLSNFRGAGGRQRVSAVMTLWRYTNLFIIIIIIIISMRSDDRSTQMRSVECASLCRSFINWRHCCLL